MKVLASMAVALSLTTAVSASSAAPKVQERRADVIHAKLYNPEGGVMVIAHRGCHNPAPWHGLKASPENSLSALEGCVTLGVDMMETDIRRSKDGALVIMHDATVDRTTNGVGRVADLTLAQLKALRLRQNFGGPSSPELTDQGVLTLAELLQAAAGRIMINLDVKEAIYPEVVAEVARLGVADQVLIKSVIDGTAASPLSDAEPYRGAPYMPIIDGADAGPGVDLGERLAVQLSARRKPAAVEMVYLKPDQFGAVRSTAEVAHVRLWSNTLTSVKVVGVCGLGGDEDALRDRGETWRRLASLGITAFQTDEPEALMRELSMKPGARNTPRARFNNSVAAAFGPKHEHGYIMGSRR